MRRDFFVRAVRAVFRPKKASGFSLIELLIAMLIVSILSSAFLVASHTGPEKRDPKKRRPSVSRAT